MFDKFNEGVIAGSLLVIALMMIFMVAEKRTPNRDFNNDGLVNIVDLSIMAEEIRIANSIK